jgi:hypothetical protein
LRSSSQAGRAPVEESAPEPPLASAAALLLDEAEPAGGEASVNHWLLTLLRRHGTMAENMDPGLRSGDLAREVAERLGAGEAGTALSHEELVPRVARSAQSRGKDRVAERDLTAAILSVAGYDVAEG